VNPPAAPRQRKTASVGDDQLPDRDDRAPIVGGLVGQPGDRVVRRESSLDLAMRNRASTTNEGATTMLHLTLLTLNVAMWAHALIASV
jgi:hypothetical protein